MSSNQAITNSLVQNQVLDPFKTLGEFQDVRETAAKSLQEGLKLLGTLISGGSTSSTSSTTDAAPTTDGRQELEAPTNTRNINDITLRIGLLQDALDQLMQQVSKTEIKSRMDEMQKENKKQLEKFEEQMAKAEEVAQKNQEAEKKGNIFEAVSNWIQAVVSVVSAVFTLVSAIGQVLTNPVGAAGLFVASAALFGVAAMQITMAVDATMIAAGKEGFLTDADKEKMGKAIEIMGYIAMAGSMIGLVGGVVVALGQAGKAAGTLAGREIGRVAAAKLVATGMKETLTKSMNMSIARVANYAFKDSMAQLTKLSIQVGTTQALGKIAMSANTGVGGLMVANIKDQASALAKEADLAEAAAKAIEAMVTKLRALIEQLQAELENMVEQAQQTLAIIFGALNEAAESLTNLHHSKLA